MNQVTLDLASKPKHLAGIMAKRKAIVKLMNSFPSLAVLRVKPDWFDPVQLDLQAGKLSSGGRAALQFVLRVWDAHQEWHCGEFNVVEALNIWDSRHRNAFVAWASDPWWL
jgi:hypothetical protein